MLVHKHLIVRAEVREPLVDPAVTIDWLKRMVDALGMKITPNGGPYCDYVDEPGNSGIAAVVIIQTSNLAVHVWDKQDPPLVQLDVYSCSDYSMDQVLPFIAELKPTQVEWKFLDRETELKVISQGIDIL